VPRFEVQQIIEGLSFTLDSVTGLRTVFEPAANYHICVLFGNLQVGNTAVVSILSLKRKDKFTLFSDYNGSLLRRQPGANFATAKIP